MKKGFNTYNGKPKQLKSLFDNYRSLITAAVFLLISFAADAQMYSNPTLYGKAERRSRVDSTSLMPTGCGAPWALSAVDIAQKRAGQYYDSCNKRFYLYDPKLNAWDTLHIGVAGAGGGTVHVRDSVSALSPLVYNSSTGVFSADTSIANTGLATLYQNGLKANKSTTLTINGSTQDLSANRSWSVGTLVGADTLNLSALIALRMKYTDSALMLLPYINAVDWGLIKTGQSVKGDSNAIKALELITLANIGSTANSKGASVTANQLTLQPASASFGGVINTSNQTLGAGNKTFSGSIGLYGTAASSHFINSSVASAGMMRINLANTTAHAGAAVGVDFTNDSGSLFRIYTGSSINSYAPDATLITTNGTNGLKFSTYGAGAKIRFGNTGIPTAGLESGVYYTMDADTLNYTGKPRFPNLTTGVGLYSVRADANGNLVKADTTTGGGSGANALGTYIVQTATNAPVNAFAMSTLATGLVKNTTGTGTPSIAVAGTDYALPTSRDIQYITQPTTGAALSSGWSAVGAPSYTVSNGQFVFSGGANNVTQWIQNDLGVLAEQVTLEAYVIINTTGVNNQGPRIGFSAYGAGDWNVNAGFVTGSSATGAGKVVLYSRAGALQYSDSANTNYANGDTLYYKLTRTGVQYTMMVENITKDWKLAKTVTSNSSSFIAHGSANIAAYPGEGSYTLYGLTYTINTVGLVDLMVVGNSITYLQEATTQEYRYAQRIGNPELNIASGGGADQIVDVYNRLGEIIAINPRAITLMIGGNDILYAGTLNATAKTNYIAIRDSLVNNGIKVIHLLPTPRNGTDLRSLVNFIDTSYTFKSDKVVRGTWVNLLTGSYSLLSQYDGGDGTHPNNAGMAAIASAINEELNFPNGNEMLPNKNLIAKNGYVLGTDNGTGANQFKSGGLIAHKFNNLYSYMQLGYYGTSGTIQAITEGASYDDIAINTAGGDVGIGESVPTSKLHVTAAGSANVEALTLNRISFFGSVDDETRLNFAYNNVNLARISNYYYYSGSNQYGLRFYTGALNATANLDMKADLSSLFNGNVGIGISPTAKLHVTAGIPAAGGAPLKLTTSGAALLTTPEPGAIEVLADSLYWTGSTGTRNKVYPQSAGSGTVTDFIFTDGNGFDGTVTTSTSTPTLSLTTRAAAFLLVTGTDANITVAVGTAYHLPSATLTTGRTIDMTNVNANGDYVEFYNNEAGFTWSFTGQTVYDSDGSTAVTELLANANSVIRRINGKLMISKL